MSAFQVTPKSLQTTGEQLARLNGEFVKATQELETQEQSLNGMWEGEAKDAFHNAFNLSKSDFARFAKAINEYVEALYAISKQYSTSEGKNVGIASRR